MNTLTRGVVAGLAAVGIGGARWLYETSQIRSVPDAQNGIAMAFSLIVSGATVLAAFLFGFLALWSFGRRMRALGTALLLGWVFVGGCTATSMVRLGQAGRALAEAADPATPPERLRALAGCPSGSGYEMDNRIASNPNTPVDVLRALHGRPAQVGTEMCLARNPNTPDDILVELSKRDDEWRDPIQQSLSLNPRYGEVLGTTRPAARAP